MTDEVLMATQQDAVDTSDKAVAEHSAKTGDVHGIPVGEEAESKTGAQGKVDTHSAKTGDVHGAPLGSALLHAGNIGTDPGEIPTNAILADGTQALDLLSLAIGGVQVGPVEVGTWTPVLVGQTTAGTNSYNAQDGTYIRIGRLWDISGRIQLDGTTGALDSTGTLRITAPSAHSASRAPGPSSVEVNTGMSIPSGSIPLIRVMSAAQPLFLRKQSATGSTNLFDSDVTDSFDIYFHATYYTD